MIPSERAIRKQQKQLLKDNLIGQKIKLLFNSDKADGMNGYEIREVPFVFVKDVPAMILDYLDRFERQGTLTWHNGIIPKDEVWIKIGGDKGGDSFKMDFQVVNVAHPNSLQNTVVFSCFEATDSMANIERALPPILEQISGLTSAKWCERSIRVFCFGDYELLNKMYGLCGCNARYCCIYCLASKTDMQQPLHERGKCQPRTLKSIREHHQLFLQDGARRPRAKDISFSVVNRPLIPVEIDHVVLPTLHISLGVFKKLYDLFERDCHDLDLELFHLRVKAQDNSDLTNFDDQVANEIERLRRIQEQLHDKRSALESAEEDLPLYVLQNEMEEIDDRFRDAASIAFKLRNDIQNLEKEAETSQLSYATGPVASSLDKVLHTFKVQRQAYHGKAFVGNHVHKCCEPKVIEALTKTPSKVIEKHLTDNMPLAALDRLRRKAATIQEKFEDIFLKFADVHKGINHTHAVTDSDIHCIGKCILQYIHTFTK
ncbi:uncharacterized protein LOC119732830 [Patiria miniata]|uniref:Uncharacterized protein n=1 Tax=Patiria miniata TaxID=46514 RepID=A0A914AF41_PATMI|nr:uncharacterized protein LOC119732830 [Patiria miniata]